MTPFGFENKKKNGHLLGNKNTQYSTVSQKYQNPTLKKNMNFSNISELLSTSLDVIVKENAVQKYHQQAGLSKDSISLSNNSNIRSRNKKQNAISRGIRKSIINKALEKNNTRINQNIRTNNSIRNNINPLINRNLNGKINRPFFNNINQSRRNKNTNFIDGLNNKIVNQNWKKIGDGHQIISKNQLNNPTNFRSKFSEHQRMGRKNRKFKVFSNGNNKNEDSRSSSILASQLTNNGLFVRTKKYFKQKKSRSRNNNQKSKVIIKGSFMHNDKKNRLIEKKNISKFMNDDRAVKKQKKRSSANIQPKQKFISDKSNFYSYSDAPLRFKKAKRLVSRINKENTSYPKSLFPTMRTFNTSFNRVKNRRFNNFRNTSKIVREPTLLGIRENLNGNIGRPQLISGDSLNNISNVASPSSTRILEKKYSRGNVDCDDTVLYSSLFHPANNSNNNSIDKKNTRVCHEDLFDDSKFDLSAKDRQLLKKIKIVCELSSVPPPSSAQKVACIANNDTIQISSNSGSTYASASNDSIGLVNNAFSSINNSTYSSSENNLPMSHSSQINANRCKTLDERFSSH